MQLTTTGPLTALRKQNAKKYAKLNLVSLMDIFTILVFFLLLNSGDQQVLQNTHFVKLPESKADVPLEDQLTIVIGQEEISVGEQPVASVDEVLENPGQIIPGLEAALSERINEDTKLSQREQQLGRAVTLMGDQDIPYTVLKSIMATCAKLDYRDISMAVTQVVSPDIGVATSAVGG